MTSPSSSRFQKATRLSAGQVKRKPAAFRLGWNVQFNESGCWEWTGYVGANGYGYIGVDREVLLVHRFAYETHVGPISDGLHIDHLCSNRRCVNPNHLEAVTQAENNRRVYERSSRSPFCRAGHDKRVVGSNSEGYCRECKKARARAYRARIKAAL